MLYLASCDIPGGRLTYLVHDGIVIGSSFRGVDDVLARVSLASEAAIEAAPRTDAVGRALRDYAGGDLRALDQVEVRQPGGDFRQCAWRAMRDIAPGTVETYAELAASAGSPRAHRAAGTACSSNLVAPFVPCHRVVASAGLGGYGYGLDVKIALLEHEGAVIPG